MAIILPFTTYIHAQKKIDFGIKAGVNFAGLYSSNSPTDDYIKMKAGFHVGPIAEMRFSELFALEVEALYSQQGSKAEIDYIEIEPPGEIETYAQQKNTNSQGNDLKSISRYDYLNVPLLAKLYVHEGLNVFAGPQLSVLLSAKDDYDSREVDVMDQLDPFDFGLLGGVGFQLDMGLFFSGSYYLGLNNISAINFENLLGYNIDIHQGVLQFSTGYKF